MKIDMSLIPGQVREVMKTLDDKGFKAYLAGGVVRDILLGRIPRDYDIATSALPGQVGGLFNKVAPTGEKYGTVTVLQGGQSVEVTTLRREGIYSDHRRPDDIEFTAGLKEDLARRDFTINAMAADLNGRVYDFFGGIPDLQAGLVKTVGSPESRFREDALRLIRAVRFACQLNFIIEKKTLKGIVNLRYLVKLISLERIREEINRILLSEFAGRGMLLLRDTGLLDYIIPDLAVAVSLPDTAAVLCSLPARLNVRLAVLMGDIGPARAEKVMARLKYDRRTVRTVTSLIKNGTTRCIPGDRVFLKGIINRVGKENLEDFFNVRQALAAVTGQEEATELEDMKQCIMSILNNHEPLQIKDLALDGGDLKEAGVAPGPEMGDMLESLLEIVLERPEMNEKEQLLGLVRNWRINKNEEKKK